MGRGAFAENTGLGLKWTVQAVEEGCHAALADPSFTDQRPNARKGSPSDEEAPLVRLPLDGSLAGHSEQRTRSKVGLSLHPRDSPAHDGTAEGEQRDSPPLRVTHLRLQDGYVLL